MSSNRLVDVTVVRPFGTLIVTTAYNPQEGSWATSIKDGTSNKELTGKHLGDYAVGYSAQWSYDFDAARRVHENAVNTARRLALRS